MWVSRKNEWHVRHSSLSKYFIEKTIQLVDYDEVISNRHRTVNGAILINEIIHLCRATLQRQKSVNRLKSLLEEATEKKITSSLSNDFILRKDFSDIITFYESFNVSDLKKNDTLNEKVVKSLQLASQVYSNRLEQYYFESIKNNLLELDENESQFRRNTARLDGILQSLIPYLLYNGYSGTSICEVMVKLIKAPGANPFEKFFDIFSFEKKNFTFLINLGTDKNEYQVFIEQLEKQKIEFTIQDPQQIAPEQIITEFQVDDFLIKLNEPALDPHSFLTSLYDNTIRLAVIGKDRTTLQIFTNFFKNSYWKKEVGFKFYPTSINLDPINSINRKSTLRNTLKKISIQNNFTFDERSDLPYLAGIEQAVFFYNLALGSKSIENSMSLLWTSLESLIPYYPKSNDIENVQHFVSYFLSAGSMGRQFNSLIIRMKQNNTVNRKSLSDIGTYRYSPFFTEKGVIEWLDWITTVHNVSSKNDPYKVLNETSILLCSQYCHINEYWGGTEDSSGTVKNGKIKYWLDKIEQSELSIRYQLDRIYLHRNQIVHAGAFMNEYSNMWSHLEWYVGKLISYCYMYHYRTGKTDFTKKEVFMVLEGEIQQIRYILEKNKDKNIIDIKDSFPIIFQTYWQFF